MHTHENITLLSSIKVGEVLIVSVMLLVVKFGEQEATAESHHMHIILLQLPIILHFTELIYSLVCGLFAICVSVDLHFV